MFAERTFLSLSCTSCSFLHSIIISLIFVVVVVVAAALVDGAFSVSASLKVLLDFLPNARQGFEFGT